MKAKALETEAPKVRRARSRNLMIRLSDREHEMLTNLANREQMTISETVRWLVRREHEHGIAGGDLVVEERHATSGVRARAGKGMPRQR